MESLLAQCADLHIKCADGSIIHANKFTMLSACSVLNQVYEDTKPEDNTLPLTGIPCSWPRIAVDLLHGLKKPFELELRQVTDAQDAFEFLGCKLLRQSLSNKLWYYLNQFKSQADLVPYVKRMMAEGPELRTKFLTKFRALGPRWVSVREVFKHADMTLESAIFCMARFVHSYPASVVFRDLFDALPASLVTPQSAMMLMSAHSGGTFFHPGELQTVMNCIMRRVPYSRGSMGYEYDFMRTVLDTMCDFEDAPVRKIGGTSIQYEFSPRVSAFVNVSKKGGGDWTIRIAPWLTLTKDTNTLHGHLDLFKIPAAREAVNCQVHITAVAEHRDHVTHKFETVAIDVWRRFDGVEENVLDLSDFDPEDDGEKEFATFIEAHVLRYIHINAFFGFRDAMYSALL